MGKIWLKSVDPARQCCGCGGKSSPCDTCCSFDLTSFEGRKDSNSAANTLFSEKVLGCREYFPSNTIKSQCEIKKEGGIDKPNIVQTINYGESGETLIDNDTIEFYHVDGYRRGTNGTIIIETKSELIDQDKKIKPPREEFCAENKVRYNVSPPIEYDITIDSTIIDGSTYSIISDLKEEIDAPESQYLEYPTEPDYSEIKSETKVTNEICCLGTKYKFSRILSNIVSSSYCLSKSLGVYRSYTYNTVVWFLSSFSAQGSVTFGNLRFDKASNKWLLNWSARMTMTYVSDDNIHTSLAVKVNAGGQYIGVSMGINGGSTKIGETASASGAAVYDSPFQIPLGVTLYLEPDNPIVYIIPDCSSLIENNIPEDNVLGDYPECDPNYICIRKDNITKSQEILGDGAGTNGDCSSSTDPSQLEGQDAMTPNLIGIIALSLIALIGGGLVGFALVAATGILGLAVAGALYYYSIKVGVDDSPIDTNGEASYQQNESKGTLNPTCDIIGEGGILKTTETYSVVGKKIIFPAGEGPPDDVSPYAPSYKYTRTYSSAANNCVKIYTKISRVGASFNGVCGDTNSNYDNIAIGFKSTISSSDSDLFIPKKVNIEVTDNSISKGYRNYTCN